MYNEEGGANPGQIVQIWRLIKWLEKKELNIKYQILVGGLILTNLQNYHMLGPQI